MRGGAGGEEALSWATQHESAAGDVLHAPPLSLQPKKECRGKKSSRAGEPRESVATSLTSVTAARQTGRQMEEEKAGRADKSALEG